MPSRRKAKLPTEQEIVKIWKLKYAKIVIVSLL